MGKSLIIKGADFSANGILNDYDITAIVGASSSWHPQWSLTGMTAARTSNTKRSCVQKFDLSQIASGYNKIRLTTKQSFVSLLLIHDENLENNYRVTGDETYDQTFEWGPDVDKIGNLSYNGISFKYFSVNIRYADNTTQFPADAVLSDYVKIELIQ